MKSLEDKMESLEKTIKYSFYALLGILLFYIAILIYNKIIFSFSDSFSLEVTYQISAFLGVILTSLFSVGGAYLLLKNYFIIKDTYLETKVINTHFISKDESEKKKQEKRLSSKLAKMFFWEIQSSYIKLVRLEIFIGSENAVNVLDDPFIENLDTTILEFSIPAQKFRLNDNRITITEHLDKLEFLSLSILNDNIDLNLIEKFLKTKFLGQVKSLLIFLAFCRSGDENYGESIIQLYKKWGGEFGHILARI